MARTRLGSPDSLVPSLGAAIRDINPSIAPYSAGSMEDQLAWTFFPARIAAIALGAFGTLALMLAATGIYGIMAYAVSRRTREIGIRMGIGASQAQVLASVARSAAILIGTGLVLGLVMALNHRTIVGANFVWREAHRSGDIRDCVRDHVGRRRGRDISARKACNADRSHAGIAAGMTGCTASLF